MKRPFQVSGLWGNFGNFGTFDEAVEHLCFKALQGAPCLSVVNVDEVDFGREDGLDDAQRSAVEGAADRVDSMIRAGMLHVSSRSACMEILRAEGHFASMRLAAKS